MPGDIHIDVSTPEKLASFFRQSAKGPLSCVNEISHSRRLLEDIRRNVPQLPVSQMGMAQEFIRDQRVQHEAQTRSIQHSLDRMIDWGPHARAKREYEVSVVEEGTSRAVAERMDEMRVEMRKQTLILTDIRMFVRWLYTSRPGQFLVVMQVIIAAIALWL